MAGQQEPQKKYSFFGDSMTYNFVKKNNYLEPIKTFPEQVAKAMGYSYELNLKESSNTECGALPGGRFTDLYAFLTDYEGDDYFKKEFGRWEQDDIDAYMSIAEESDVLSIQMGYSGVTMVLLQNIISILDNGEQKYSVDINQLFTGNELDKIMPIAARAKDLVGQLFTESTKEALKEFVNGLTETQQEALKKMFGEEAVNAANGTLDIVSKILDNFIYLLAAQMVHFDRTVETLYEINPDLELYIMGLTNPVQYMKLSFNLGDAVFYIPLGDILGVYFDIANLYMKVLSPNSTRYYYVDNVKHAHTYGEAMAEDINVSRNILYTVYNNGKWTDHENTESEAYKKADAHARGVMEALKNTSTINLSRLLDELPEDFNSISLSSDVACLDKLMDFDENGELTASYLEQMMAAVYFFSALKGLFVHPDQEGHDVQAPLLIKAMQNPTVNPAAIAYHELAQPFDEVISELKKCTTPAQFAEWINNLPKKLKEQKAKLDIATSAIEKNVKKTTISAIGSAIKQTVEKIEKGIKETVSSIKTVTTSKITPIIPQISIFKKIIR